MDGYTGTFELVDLNTIIVDHRYQRELKPALVAAIATDPRWELFGVPVLFKRGNGMLYVADGQQRITGLKQSQSPPKKIPAVWFPVTGLDDEAAAFVQINEFRKSLTALEKHKGKIVAKDPSTLAIERAADTVGVTIGGGTGGSADARTVTAVAALYQVYNDLGEEGLVQTLVVCRDAFADDSGAFGASILRGVAEIIAEQNGAYERQKLTRALQKTTVPQILRQADALRFDLGGSKQKNIRRAIKHLAKV